MAIKQKSKSLSATKNDLSDGFFQLKVLNVNRLGKAEVNDDFFKKAFPNGEVKSLDELKAHIIGQMKDYLGQQAEIKLENDMFDSLLNDTEIPLPEAFLKRWIKTTNEKPITDEQIEDDFDKVTRDIKWSLIENKLSQEYNINIGGVTGSHVAALPRGRGGV